MGRVKRLTEDSFDGTAYIKLCGTSCPYDGEYCASDECPVLNEVAGKLARYEKLEEQIAELAEQRIQNGTITSYAIIPEVTKGIVDIAFEQFERSKKNEQST